MRKVNWEVVPATLEDFAYFGQEVAYSLRAWVLISNGKRAGIGGVTLSKGAYTVFLRVAEDISVSKRILYQAMKMGFDNILQVKLPVLYAIRDKGLESSSRLLPKFTFQFMTETNGEEIYKWHKQL